MSAKSNELMLLSIFELDKEETEIYGCNVERHFPNECFVCKQRNVHPCKKCNMISYCSDEHRQRHLSNHESLCETVSKILKERKLTNLYEKIQVNSLTDLIECKKEISCEVQQKLGRPFRADEEKLFRNPRLCCVCFEGNPEKLRSCSKCTAASFCNKHNFSFIHERACRIIRNKIQWLLKNGNLDEYASKCLAENIGQKTRILGPDDSPPLSLTEYFDSYLKFSKPMPLNQKVFLSNYCTLVLTVFSALKAIPDSIRQETIIFVDVKDAISGVSFSRYWETLLHLLPEIKILRIVYFDGPKARRTEIPLCDKCRTRKKRLFTESKIITFEQYVNDNDNCLQPSLFCSFNVRFNVLINRNEKVDQVVERWKYAKCPVLFTTQTEYGMKIMSTYLTSSRELFNIIYEGYNDFRPDSYFKELDDGQLYQSSQFMIIFKRENMLKHSSSMSHPIHFYSTVCHVCQASNSKVHCNRCKFIFYCSTKHRDQDRLFHRDFCKIIESLLKEMQVEYLFEKFKTEIPELWTMARINFMLRVRKRMKKTMTEYEEQMFFYPKACQICHDSNINVLEICKCGGNLCRRHKNHENHKKFCKELELSRKIPTHGNVPIFLEKFVRCIEYIENASSMQDFIDRQSIILKVPKLKSIYDDIWVSRFLTIPLTLIYVIREFNVVVNSSFVVHMIGAIKPDAIPDLWRIMLILFNQLKKLTIVFIGPFSRQDEEFNVETNFPRHRGKSLTLLFYKSKYELYSSDEKFVHPNIVFFSNIHVHVEKEVGHYFPSRKDVFIAWKQFNVPLILTAGTKEYVKKDMEVICEYVEARLKSHFIEENPFASLAPHRDFEKEGVAYLNKSIIFCDGSVENPSSEKDIELIKNALEKSCISKKG